MTPPDFIIALFYAVDQEMLEVPKHPEAKLIPAQSSRWPCCMLSKAAGPGPSIAG